MRGQLEAASLCLVTGAALGCLFLLCKGARLALGLGKWATALLDVLFCLFCGGTAFLCALAVDRGRLRLLQVVCQGLGAWAAVTGLDPLVEKLGFFLRKTFCRLWGHLPRGRAFVRGLFPGKPGARAENGKKSGRKGKKEEKKT